MSEPGTPDLDPRLAEVARLVAGFGLRAHRDLLAPARLRVMAPTLPDQVMSVFTSGETLFAEIPRAWPRAELDDWLDPARRTRILASSPLTRDESDESLRGWLGVRLAGEATQGLDAALGWYLHWQISDGAMMEAMGRFNASSTSMARIAARDGHLLVRSSHFCPGLPDDLVVRHLLGDALAAQQIFELNLRTALRAGYQRLRSLSGEA